MHGVAVQEPQRVTLVFRLVHTLEQHVGLPGLHLIRISRIPLSRENSGRLPATAQDPQFGLRLKSAQDPEQHAGCKPVHGAAVQEPQRVTFVRILVHTPEQHVGLVELH